MSVCPHCGEESLFVPEAVYEGLRKTGEVRRCASCGKTVEAGGAAGGGAKPDPLAALFGEERETDDLNLFDVEAETARLCRKCRHYVVHPFTQRCGLHDREVAATDSCPDFQPREP